MISRKASSGELPEIEKIFLEIARAQQNQAEFSWDEEQIKDEILQAQFFIHIRDEGITAFVAYREMANIIEISALGTRPSCRRQGCMRLLLKDVLDYCRVISKQVHLEVHSKNYPAQALYESLGFKLLRRRTQYYKDGADALVLAALTNE